MVSRKLLRARRNAADWRPLERPATTTHLVSVANGQLWELRTAVVGGVARFRIERIDGGMAHGTFVETGRKSSLHVSTLERRSRGARLVECADGSPPGSRPPYKRPPEVERTASDFRRLQPPRGLTPTERAAWLREPT